MVNYTAVVLMLKHHNPNPCIIVVTKDYKVEMDNDHWNYWSSIHLVYLIIYIYFNLKCDINELTYFAA